MGSFKDFDKKAPPPGALTQAEPQQDDEEKTDHERQQGTRHQGGRQRKTDRPQQGDDR